MIDIKDIDMAHEIGNCVYFIGALELPRVVKIGKTKDLNKRLAGLATANHNNLIVYKQYMTEDSANAEKYLHLEAQNKRIKGEWFKLTIEEIDELYLKLVEKYPNLDLPRTLIEIKKEYPTIEVDPRNLINWYLNNNIRAIQSPNDVDSLLFLLVDVAKVIGDADYEKFKSKELRIMEMKGANGKKQNYLMLTERGIYEYLILSKRPAATSFIDFVFDLLVNVRKKNASKFERNFRI